MPKKSKDFASKHTLNRPEGHPEAKQKDVRTKAKQPIGQFTGPASPGNQKK